VGVIEVCKDPNDQKLFKFQKIIHNDKLLRIIANKKGDY